MVLEPDRWAFLPGTENQQLARYPMDSDQRPALAVQRLKERLAQVSLVEQVLSPQVLLVRELLA